MIEREIAWLLAQQFGRRAKLLVTWSKDDDCRICEGEHGRPNSDCATVGDSAAGAERVYAEKQSGAKTDRAQLAKAIAALGEGDCLIVTKLDRLARSTRDLLNTLAEITQRGASFKSLGDSWADTTTPAGKLMLTVLGGLAEYERHLILARTGEGRARAQAKGVRVWQKAQADRTSTARSSGATGEW